MPKKVNFRIIKRIAPNFPDPLKSLLLLEPDEMEIEEFIFNLGIWEKLLLLGREKLE